MLNYNDLKPGTFMVFEGQPYVVMEFHFLRMQRKEAGCPDKNQKYHHRQNGGKNFPAFGQV